MALGDVALATAGNLGFLAEAEVNRASRPRTGNHLYGSFARDFGTRDGRQALGPTSVLWSVYRSFSEMVESDDVHANPMMGVIDQPGVGHYLAAASPIRADDREPVRAPLLGEHTAQILRTDLGLSEHQIKDLHERGVVASASPER